MRNDNHYIID